MASGTVPPTAEGGGRPLDAPPSRYEALIDERLRHARRQVKTVDIVAGLMTLTAGSFLYLLLATVADHWLVSGGFGPAGRILLFIGLILLAGFYCWRHVFPFLLYRINPIFAAQVIEEGRPSLKNGLVNLLFLRREQGRFEGNRLARQVLHGLEQDAAAELEQLPKEDTVDHSRVIRLGYVLVAILVICALYLLLSPKNLLASFGRVVLPWADIQAPTRVMFESIRPGDHAAYQGDTVEITAIAKNLRPGEEVLLYYTTADGQRVDQAIPMTVPEGGYRHRCNLPPGSDGLQQKVAYYLSAGDCQSRRFFIEVSVPPTILVDRLRYDYPDYTGLADRVDDQTGDIQAIEGTGVAIEATANLPIQHAWMEISGASRQALNMAVQGDRARGKLTLRMSRDDPSRPQYDSYQIRFTDASRRENRRPARHEIQVIPDVAPEVALVDPPADRVEIPVDGQLDLRIRAQDPDFGLRRVRLRAERGGQPIQIGPLLSKPLPEPAHEGPFETSYRFQPASLKLQAGDEVIYWAEAEDNKQTANEPDANRTATSRRRIRIAGPETGQPESPPPQTGQDRDQTPRGEPDRGRRQPDPSTSDEQQPQPGAEERSESQAKDPQPQGDDQQQGADSAQGRSGQDERGQQDQPNQEQGTGESSPQGAESQPGGQREGSQESDQEQPGQSSQGTASGTQSGDQPGAGEDGQQGGGERQTEREGQSSSSSSGQSQEGTGQPSDGASEQPSGPVNPETDPGEAIRRILDHQEEQPSGGGQSPQQGAGSQNQPGTADQGEQPGRQQDGAQGDGASQRPSQGQSGGGPSRLQDEQGDAGTERQGDPGPEQQGGRQENGQPGERSPQDRSGQQETGTGESKQSNPKSAAGEVQPEAGPQGQNPNDQTDGAQQPTSQQGRRSESEQGQPSDPSGQMPAGGEDAAAQEKPDGAQEQSGGPGQQDPSQTPSGKQCNNPDCKDGSCQECQGQSGAGQSSGQNTGAPTPQQSNTPRQKKPSGQPGSEKPGQEQTGQSPSNSPRQSDSESDTSGDKSGGGEEGGGQKANRPGQGTPGTNSPAEQGGEPSNQQGPGQTGPGQGDQVPADQPAGSPASDSRGPGSRSRPGGQQPGEEPQAGQQSKPRDSADSQQPGVPLPPGQNSQLKPARGSGPSVGGGVPNDQQAGPPPAPQAPSGPDGDEGNLQYAREQTELALEHLEEQLAEEDPDLLDRLGWTRQDAEKFLRRWEQMQQAAGRDGEEAVEAKRQMDETIRGLGIRPRGTQLDSSSIRRRVSDVRDSRRFDPPPEWDEWVNEYKRSIASGGN